MKQTMKQGFAVFLFLGSMIAWAKGNLELKNDAFQEKEIIAKDGTKSKKLLPAVKVVPGDEVVFVITYRNAGKESATDVIITNPIPKNMIYRSAESDKAEIKPEVSVDGGKKFGELASLKVNDKVRKLRPALPDDVTHVRWKVATAVQPKEEGKLRLRAVLK